MKSSKIKSLIAVVGTVCVSFALIKFMNSGDDDSTRNLQSIKPFDTNSLLNDTVLKSLYSNFLSKYNKQYLSTQEFVARMSVFQQNLNMVKQFSQNNKNALYTLALNQFADLTNPEFSKMMGFNQTKESIEQDHRDYKELSINDLLSDSNDQNTSDSSNTTLGLLANTTDTQAILASLPNTTDWRKAWGYIRNQNGCASCYAFAATAALESAYFQKYGITANFAEQQLIDCSGGNYWNLGCDGGTANNCFRYWTNFKVMNESNYPYIYTRSYCKYNDTVGLFKVKSYNQIKTQDPVSYMVAVSKRPITAALNLDPAKIKLYKGGILDATICGPKLNHVVTIVGYGSANGVDYWLLRNSWGASWGEGGYFRMIRSMNSGYGVCGIYQLSSYPVLE